MRHLKDWFDKSSLTQKELAEKFGVSQATVSDWLNGNMAPQFDRLKEIRDRTGISLAKLVEDCAENAQRRTQQRNSAA